MDIKAIQQAIRQGYIFFTDHAVRQMASRGIMDGEAIEAILRGEVIEEYPQDKYGPSCLIFGDTNLSSTPTPRALLFATPGASHHSIRAEPG